MNAEQTMKWLRLAVSSDGNRPVLQHVWCLDGKLYASDGHRIHVAPVPNGRTFASDSAIAAHWQPYTAPAGMPPDFSKVIPEHAGELFTGVQVQYAVRSALTVSNAAAQIAVATAVLGSALACATPSTAAAQKRAAQRAVSDVAVELTIGSDNVAYVYSPTHPERKWSIGNLPTPEYADVHATLNGRYLLDALGPRPEHVHLLLTGPADPVKITHADGRVAVIMPMRL